MIFPGDGEIPTALTEAETIFLMGLAWDRRVHEAGALLGHSTLALAQGARSVVSVDPHHGYPQGDAARSTEAQYLYNVHRYDARRVVIPVIGDFREHMVMSGTQFAWGDLTGEHKLTLDFLHHTRYVPVVAVHDYGRAGCGGATRAVDEYIASHRVRRVTRVDSIVVLENQT